MGGIFFILISISKLHRLYSVPMKWLMFLMLPALCFAFFGDHKSLEHFRYQITVTDPTTSTVTAQSFATIPSLVMALNHRELEGNKIELFYDWQKPYFSAWVSELAAKSYRVSFWGGLARIPGMSDEAHALIACHELGHVAGGTPKIKLETFLWSSSEGQSDYFATGICLKRYFAFLFDAGKLETPATSRRGFTLCRTRYTEEKDFQICLVSIKGIESFAQALVHLDPEKKKISLSTPSSKRVRETLFNSYPDSQCRMDTLLQGALCPRDKFPCSQGTGARPQCWFAGL